MSLIHRFFYEYRLAKSLIKWPLLLKRIELGPIFLYQWDFHPVYYRRYHLFLYPS
jgi:hypothetical protein